MNEKEFELFAKDKFIEIVKEFEKLHPGYDMLQIELFPNTQRIHINYVEGEISHTITFDLKEDKENDK